MPETERERTRETEEGKDRKFHSFNTKQHKGLIAGWKCKERSQETLQWSIRFVSAWACAGLNASAGCRVLNKPEKMKILMAVWCIPVGFFSIRGTGDMFVLFVNGEEEMSKIQTFSLRLCLNCIHSPPWEDFIGTVNWKCSLRMLLLCLFCEKASVDSHPAQWFTKNVFKIKHFTVLILPWAHRPKICIIIECLVSKCQFLWQTIYSIKPTLGRTNHIHTHCMNPYL